MLLPVKIIPKSAKNELVGWENDALKIRLRAVPEKGEANEALIEFLSNLLGISKSRIIIVRGHQARHKQVELIDFSKEELTSITLNAKTPRRKGAEKAL